MPTERLILCAHKKASQIPHERISHIGGVDPDGRHWKLSVSEAVESIQNRDRSFMVLTRGNVFPVVVAESATGERYLRAESDGEQPDSLLSLPDCQ
jgi:hypothetical protein